MGFGLSDIKNIFDKPAPAETPNNSVSIRDALLDIGEGTYTLRPSNWYRAQPYGFRFTPRFSDNAAHIMFLPISPSNLNVTTSFATNTITTLYGTVEEHSPVRYYDISIEGTTGLAPKFVEPGFSNDPGDVWEDGRLSGRSSFAIKGDILDTGGFFAKTMASISKTYNQAKDLWYGSNDQTKRGLSDENSGYVAFHNLYRFLLKYKQDASGVENDNGEERGVHPLYFFNYKDGVQYKVIVRSFSMRRSAENPMLYYYSIQLRGYDLETVASNKLLESLTDRYKDLGLDGVNGSSALGKMKELSAQAKSVIGSALGGLNVIGR